MAKAPAGGEQPIIVKKIKKGGHAHHGGAWKVAYADMVTAMMAFFLVMWICNFDIKTRLGIAEYFASPSVYGPNKPSSWFVLNIGGVPRMSQGNIERHNEKGGDPRTNGTLRIQPLPDDNFDKAAAELYAKSIRLAFEQDPNLQPYKDQIAIEVTMAGLRVDLMESDKLPIFAPATAIWTASGRMVAQAMANLMPKNHRFIFEGHTTPKPEVRGISTKWELGADRAAAVRQLFQVEGLPINQVLGVNSYADTQPRPGLEPTNPRQMRVTSFVPYTTKPIKVMDD